MIKCINCKSSLVLKKFTSYNNITYNICAVCKSHYQNPIIELDYNDSYWENAIDPDGNKRHFIDEREFKIQNWYGQTIDFVNKKKNIKVLDIGCGLGYFLSALNKDITKVGIEESEYATKYIKNNFKDINIYNGNFLEIDVKEKFDVIMFYHVLEHLKEPHTAIKKIKTILKKNGTLILGTPNIGSFGAKLFAKNYRLYGPEHICLYELKELKKILKNYNFFVYGTEKPFFKTQYFTLANILKLLKRKDVSPPFYSSIVTIYASNK